MKLLLLLITVSHVLTQDSKLINDKMDYKKSKVKFNQPLIVLNEKVTYDVKSMKSMKCLGQQVLNEQWRKEVDLLTTFDGEKYSLTKFFPTDDTAKFDYVEPTIYTFSQKLKSEISEGPYVIVSLNDKTLEYRLIEQHSNRNMDGFIKLDVYIQSDLSEKEAFGVRGGIMIYQTKSEWKTIDGRLENQQAGVELKLNVPQKKQKTVGMSKPKRIVFRA